MTTISKVLRRASISRAAGIGRPALVALLACIACLAGAASASAESAIYSTYSAIQSVPVPPASNFAGAGGGDGWSIALSETNVYNVFHHNTQLDVACKVQATAEPCYEPAPGVKYAHITDESGHEFLTSGHPGMYLDHHTGKLYVYATRANDGTAGVVCVDTTKLPEASAFCGFTELSGEAEAPNIAYGGISGPILIGHHWYAFNYFEGKEQTGSENKLMCFDTSTDAACSGQPFAVAVGSGTYDGPDLPSPALGSSGTDVIIPVNVGATDRLACWDDATQSSCAGSWPAASSVGTGSYGSPIPMLDATGKVIGVCLPTGTDPCYNLAGETATTPAGLAGALSSGSSVTWNGPGLVLGPRVYIPEWSNVVACFDYSTGSDCANFPKSFQNLNLLYTVNPDPQRPTCLWVNSDDGSDQIQSFDAYTGEACGGGTVRVLASQFVAPAPQCAPANYVSLQVLEPPRSSYASGLVAFANGDGELIPGMPEIALDETGSASLSGLDLNTTTGLPQFLFALKEPTGPVGSVKVRLTWEGNYDESCTGENITVTKPPSPTPTPAAAVAATTATPSSGVLAIKAAAPKACTSKREFTIHIQNAKQLGLVSAVVKIDGKNAKTLRGKRLSTAINLVGLPQGTFTVEIVGRRRDGRTVKGERVYHTCVPKLPGHAYLPL